MLVHPKLRNPPMTASKRIVLSSDHAAIALRQAIAAHISAQGWEAVDIGPTTPQSTPYPLHAEAAARRVVSGDCRFGLILCGTGQGVMMAANKVRGVRCGAAKVSFRVPALLPGRSWRMAGEGWVTCLRAPRPPRPVLHRSLGRS